MLAATHGLHFVTFARGTALWGGQEIVPERRIRRPCLNGATVPQPCCTRFQEGRGRL